MVAGVDFVLILLTNPIGKALGFLSKESNPQLASTTNTIVKCAITGKKTLLAVYDSFYIYLALISKIWAA